MLEEDLTACWICGDKLYEHNLDTEVQYVCLHPLLDNHQFYFIQALINPGLMPYSFTLIDDNFYVDWQTSDLDVHKFNEIQISNFHKPLKPIKIQNASKEMILRLFSDEEYRNLFMIYN